MSSYRNPTKVFFLITKNRPRLEVAVGQKGTTMADDAPRTAVYVVIQSHSDIHITIGKRENMWATTSEHTRILHKLFEGYKDVYLFFTTYADRRSTQFFNGLARMKELPCRPLLHWYGDFGKEFKVDWIVKDGTAEFVCKPTDRQGTAYFNDTNAMPAWIARAPLHTFLNMTQIDAGAPANVVDDARAHLGTIPLSTQIVPTAPTAPSTTDVMVRKIGRPSARNINAHFKTISTTEASKVVETDLASIKKKETVKTEDPKRITSKKSKRKARALRRKKKEEREIRRKKRTLRKARKKKV